MPVVIHSQKRKKCASAGCRSSARWAECRCRYTVTATMVTWVSTSVMAISVQGERSQIPLLSQLSSQSIEAFT